MKSKQQILKDKIELIKSWILEINKGYFINHERGLEDYEHEIAKKLWVLKETVRELKEHETWLAQIN